MDIPLGVVLGEVLQPHLFCKWLERRIASDPESAHSPFRIPVSWVACYLEEVAPHLNPFRSYFPLTTRDGQYIYLPSWITPPAVPTNDYMHNARGMLAILRGT